MARSFSWKREQSRNIRTGDRLAQESSETAGTNSSNARKRFQTELDLHSQKAGGISDRLGAGGSQLGRGRARS
jgi:hypothetical protein